MKRILIVLAAILLSITAVAVEKKMQESLRYANVSQQDLGDRDTGPRPGYDPLQDGQTSASPSGRIERRGRDLRSAHDSHPQRIIVKYKKSKTVQSKQTLCRTHNMSRLKYIPLADIHVYKLAEPDKKKAVLEALNSDDSVQYAEPDYVVKINTIPDDPEFNLLWGLHSDHIPDIDAPEAWDISTGSAEVTVAVIDTGVDYTHPDLAANMWQNPGEIPGDGIDNDSNGYIDDLHGIDSVRGNGDPMDDNSHGTHCSGTIGAVGNNGIGVAGVCWNVKIMALKCFPASGSGYISDAVPCIEYAVAHGANIINASWGGTYYSYALNAAITAAENAGVLVVASAGNSYSNNDTRPQYPSSYPHDNIIAVAAVGYKMELELYSCYGLNSVDVAAPGNSIRSTTPGSTYSFKSGTSMAAPHVAGLAALIKSNEPELTASQIKNRILSTVKRTNSMKDKILSGGLINAYYALIDAPYAQVTLTNPRDETILSGTAILRATPAGPVPTAQVEFYIDGRRIATVDSAPWEFHLDTTSEPNGIFTLNVILTDTNNRKETDETRVRINNSGAPAALITAPTTSENRVGIVAIETQAAHAEGISRVEFLVDGVSIGEDTTAPYRWEWNSGTVENGTHSLMVRVHGTDSTVGQDTVRITTDNTRITAGERAALIALYNITNGDSWSDKSNWKKADGSFNDPGTEHLWYGVRVEENRVTCISMWRNNLNGPLPAELAGLRYLDYLDLSSNSLNGTLPPELATMTSLRCLELPRNNLTGPIPEEWYNFPGLERIYLHYNNLSGPLSPQLGTLSSLTVLSLQDNPFGGSIPPELGNLTLLSELALSGCNLSGTIPPELGKLTNCYDLGLARNELTGTIPPELGNMKELQFFAVPLNQLSGEIPAELATLPKLLSLNVWSNRLTGEIPSEFAGHPELRNIYVDNNQITSIPPWLGTLTSLRYFTMENNQAQGSIPSGVGNLSNLTSFQASNNRFTGTIPAEFGNLTGLRYLSLDGNTLTGPIPAQLGNMSALRTLYLQGNGLSGTIPPELANLTQLTGLRLTGNILTGHVPAALLGLEKLSPSKTDLGYNGLRTYNTELKAFLADLSPYWEDTQTVFPSDITVTPLTPTSIEVSWTPVQFNWSSGGYIVYYSTVSGGPYTYYGITADKTATSMTVSGLAADTQYYFKVRTLSNPLFYNTNTVASHYSAEVTRSPLFSITVVSPDGGEILTAGSTTVVSWNSFNTPGNVNIYYSSTGFGGTFVPVAADVANTGSFQWNVPEIDSSTCVLRITDATGAVSDISNGLFTIEPTAFIRVVSPNGGERWQRGEAHQINWLVSNISGNVTIDLYKGESFHANIGTAPAASGQFTWNIPADFGYSEAYKIRIHQSQLHDDSDENFAVTRKQVHYVFHGGDFDGDGCDDLAVYRPLNGRWCVKGAPSVSWGIPGDIPVPGDYNGDGTTDIAIFRPSTGRWCIKGQASIAWGTATDIPVPGDYDGDGTTDIAIYRPSNGRWCIKGQTSQAPGVVGDIPVPADYDADGTTDVAVFRPATGCWYIMGQDPIAWGTSTDIPVVADYNGDGTADIAIFRPSTGRWCIKGQSSQAWGTGSDYAVPADYDGDGSADIAIFRPSNGTWAIKGLPSERYGVSTDIPLVSHRGYRP
ncbi:MAG: S8 family serine peptidase [bacterium]|nr:S8 family serine peptidase [bacterium]